MSPISYIPLLIPLGMNIVIDKKRHKRPDDALEKQQAVNSQILSLARDYDFGPMKHVLYRLNMNEMTRACADLAVNWIDPKLPEQYFYRKKLIHNLLDMHIMDAFAWSEDEPINVINIGAGFHPGVEQSVRFHQDTMNISYTLVDPSDISDIREDMYDKPGLAELKARNRQAIGLDMNEPDSVSKIIAALPYANNNIIVAEAVLPYMQTKAANRFYQELGTLPNAVFITTHFSHIDMKHDKKGRRQGEFVNYHFAVADEDALDWAAGNNLEVVDYYLPSRWLKDVGQNKEALDGRPQLERILVTKGSHHPVVG